MTILGTVTFVVEAVPGTCVGGFSTPGTCRICPRCGRCFDHMEKALWDRCPCARLRREEAA